jgi:hypothetical protein
VRTTVLPNERNPMGVVIDALFSIDTNIVRVFDTNGRLLGTGAFKPGDDIEAVARRVLREKHNENAGFYGRLPYRTH